MKIRLFIPAYNVENSVVDVLSRIPPEALERIEQVDVIDNGSQDRTRERVLEYIRGREKFRFFQNERNYSLGGSTIIAFREAIQAGSDYLICMHSDGQADPALLTQLIARCDGGNDLIAGSRFVRGSDLSEYSFVRNLGNRFFIELQKRLLGCGIADIGAYLAFNLKTVSRLPYYRIPHDMGYHPLLILMMFRNLDSVTFQEIPMRWGKVESTHVNPVLYGLSHLWRILRLSIGKIPMTEAKLEDFRTQEVPAR